MRYTIFSKQGEGLIVDFDPSFVGELRNPRAEIEVVPAEAEVLRSPAEEAEVLRCVDSIDALVKALEAGYRSPQLAPGGPLKIEAIPDLPPPIFYDDQHIRLWKEMNRENLRKAFDFDATKIVLPAGLRNPCLEIDEDTGDLEPGDPATIHAALESIGAKMGADFLRTERKVAGVCQECGHAGEWIAMALLCPTHGRIMG